MKKSEQKFLCGYYAIALVLTLLFPPWTITSPSHISYKVFAGFEFIFSKHLYYENIHVTFLFLEILVVTLIFVAILYTNKEDK